MISNKLLKTRLASSRSKSLVNTGYINLMAGVYILQNNQTGGNDFFYKWGKMKNETHKPNPDNLFFPTFPFQDFSPQFLHKILNKCRRFAQIVSFE